MTNEQKLELLNEIEQAEKEANTQHIILFKEVAGNPDLLICKSKEYQHLFPERFSKEQRDEIVQENFPDETGQLRCFMISIRTSRRDP
ncbi:MAG: hypothetical protein AAGE93_15060 [Bacteroidota bacterium]